MKLIKFSTDKNGKRLALYWMKTAMSYRWVRMNIEAAEMEIALGTASEVLP